MRTPTTGSALDKDLALDSVANTLNVAQFVSIVSADPLRLRCHRVAGIAPDWKPSSLRELIATTLRASGENRLNVRTVVPGDPLARGHAFHYGLSDPQALEAAIFQVLRCGQIALVNETIDIDDGGISGVLAGSILEVAPGATPRCVETSGTMSIDLARGRALLGIAYGIDVKLSPVRGRRLEFSLHPYRRGYRHDHLVVWDDSQDPSPPPRPLLLWPNDFSRFLGDKAFGLLLATVSGLPVPHTTVLTRRLAPFTFGAPRTGRGTWIRTCPREPDPGRFATQPHWTDPFALLQREDPEGSKIPAILIQDEVTPRYSGGSLEDPRGRIHVEGVAGPGIHFMQGRMPIGALPKSVHERVAELHARARAVLGPVHLEWVDDGTSAWVLQVHQGPIPHEETIVVPGTRRHSLAIDSGAGLPALRELVQKAKATNAEILIHGSVGLTSHFAEILRLARVPARMLPSTGEPTGPNQAPTSGPRSLVSDTPEIQD